MDSVLDVGTLKTVVGSFEMDEVRQVGLPTLYIDMVNSIECREYKETAIAYCKQCSFILDIGLELGTFAAKYTT